MNESSTTTTCLQAYIDQSCSNAVNQLSSIWLTQLLQNLTLLVPSVPSYNASNTSTGSMPDVANASLSFLEAALVTLLGSSQVLEPALENYLTASPTFQSAIWSMVAVLRSNMTTFFLLIEGIFVFLMQAGFGLMEMGRVRTKNLGNSIYKNSAYAFIAALGYWTVGYGISFGDTYRGVIGTTLFGMEDIPDLTHWFFRYTLCATALGILTGAIAERAQLAAYLVFGIIASTLTYPFVVHWCWSPNGWLVTGSSYNISTGTVQIGYYDFAGSGVVHVYGGMASLVAIMFLGPRAGRFKPNGDVVDIPVHSIPLIALGAMTLYTGFMSFTTGCQMSIGNLDDALPIGRSVANTMLAATGAYFTVCLAYRYFWRRWAILPAVSAGVAGCVAACASSNIVEGWAAFSIGIAAGIVYMLFVGILLAARLDDPCDSIACHLGGGIVGIYGLGFFKINEGVLYNWDWRSGMILGWQTVGLCVIIAWSGVTSYIIFFCLKALNMLRVDAESEARGLDIAHGHEICYPIAAYEPPNIHCLGLAELANLPPPTMSQSGGWAHPIGKPFLDFSSISLVSSDRSTIPTLASLFRRRRNQRQVEPAVNQEDVQPEQQQQDTPV